MTNKLLFKAGCKDSIPMLFGLIPFAILTGVSAINAGMAPFTAEMSSILLMSGASQIAAASVMVTGAGPLVVIITHIAINFRYAIYSAGLSQLKLQLSPMQKLAAAQLLIDQTYALTYLRSHQESLTSKEKTIYYFGTALPMWLVWQLGTLAGIYCGPLIPSSWDLDFAITLCFISLLVPMIKNRSIFIAVFFSGLVSVFTCHWSYNLGFLTSIVIGVLIGGLFNQFMQKPSLNSRNAIETSNR